MRKEGQPASQRGIALISVLWVGIVLGALAAAVMALSRSDLDLARSLRAQAEAELAADSAARTAIYALVNRAEGPIAADGSVTAWRIGDAEVRVEVTSEHGRVDLNRSAPDLIAALLAEAGAEATEAERLAAAIADFTDEDDALTASGAERPDYRAAGLPGPKNAPLEHEAELLGVLGMTAGLYRRIEEAVTVHSGRPRPRDGHEGPLVTAALGAVAPEPAREPLPPAFSVELDATPVVIRPEALATSSDLVRIRAEAETLSGARAARIAVVSLRVRGGTPSAALAWRRGSPELFPPRAGPTLEE
jgi:general secretion pathway protein K